MVIYAFCYISHFFQYIYIKRWLKIYLVGIDNIYQSANDHIIITRFEIRVYWKIFH